jgi:iron complex outermembrane receptor protein
VPQPTKAFTKSFITLPISSVTPTIEGLLLITIQRNRKLGWLTVASLLIFIILNLSAPAYAQQLAPMVVTGTRIGQDPQNIPMAIDTVDKDAMRDQTLQVNLSESLQRVPGINVQNRGNYAQDLQISSRGFGGRASFGVRGIKLFTDGIPASQPDGQGQVSHFLLSSAERVEVLRGPFSALYGNASGGVIQIFTEAASKSPTGVLSLALGSNHTWRAGTRASGQFDNGLGIVADASEFHTDGSRPHSGASKTQGQIKFTKQIENTKLTLLINSVNISADDALGLSRAEFNANPDQTTPSALLFNTRKTTRQDQAGLRAEHAFSAQHALEAVIYAGSRNVTQWQSIPVAAQLAATQPGGVIAFSRTYSGLDARYVYTPEWGNMIIGTTIDSLDEARRGYENFIGVGANSTLGVTGNLRRDEQNNVRNQDAYAQSEFKVSPSLFLTAGVRYSHVRFVSEDHFIIAGKNPDDSGRASYTKTTPAVGASFKIIEGFNIYASTGRGFETPTFNELGYRASGATGLNFDLKPAVSNSTEIGAKYRDGIWHINLAAFGTHTRDEIVTLTNSGGRATFQNAGSTTRRGTEASVAASFAASSSAQIDLILALTALSAKYDDAFKTCVSAPCVAPSTVVPAGNKLPGVPASSIYIESKWTHAKGFSAGIDARRQSKIYVNDLNTDAALAYTLFSARAGYTFKAGSARITAGVRADNLTNKRYAATVIVNEGNGRYFEPAPSRVWLATLNISFPF